MAEMELLEKQNQERKGFAFPPALLKVKELLANSQIRVPHYQRPYKWSAKNVNQLIDDILLHRKHTAYRLGTLVMHQEEDELNIVDGQQRSITLTLIAQAIYLHQQEELKNIDRKDQLHTYQPNLAGLKFRSRLSKQNIQQNYRLIERRIREFDAAAIDFFYHRCELVQVVIEDISEAFQFFDSQNSRGRDLEPHDLLKAFHLREMSGKATEAEKLASVASWEAIDTKELARLFRNYLFRVRHWSKGYHARYFTKNKAHTFKGVSPQLKETYPFASLHRIAHFYIDAYNQEYHRQIDQGNMVYPFQLDGVLINGKRFFEMIGHYRVLLAQVKSLSKEALLDESDTKAREIMKKLDSYHGKDRIGDKYVRNLFDCCLLYYIDKFGTADLGRAIEKFFIWAYSLRLNQQVVKLASMDNYALENQKIFKRMRESLQPSDVLNIPLPAVSNVRATKVDDIKQLFISLNYYHG